MGTGSLPTKQIKGGKSGVTCSSPDAMSELVCSVSSVAEDLSVNIWIKFFVQGCQGTVDLNMIPLCFVYSFAFRCKVVGRARTD